MAIGTAGAPSEDADSIRAGFISGVTAYVLWGFSVIFYKWLTDVPASEVIAHRIVWTVFFVGLFLVAFGRLGEVLVALRDRRVLWRLLISASIIGVNWLVFVWAIGQNEVLAVSFGYFINPLVSVMIGFLLLGERLSTGQRVAIGLAVVAIVIQATTLHGFPWISLFLACSFACYGYVRKLTPVGASPGLFIETSLILPIGLAYVVWLEATGAGHFTDSPVDMALLLGTGIVTLAAADPVCLRRPPADPDGGRAPAVSGALDPVCARGPRLWRAPVGGAVRELCPHLGRARRLLHCVVAQEEATGADEDGVSGAVCCCDKQSRCHCERAKRARQSRAARSEPAALDRRVAYGSSR